jgi:hypothetical protein
MALSYMGGNSMALTGEQCERLVQTLLSSFPNEDALRQLVKYQLNRNLAEIARGATLHDIVFNLVEWAESKGNVLALYRGARRLNPDNPELKAIQKDFDPQSNAEDMVIEALKLFGLHKWKEAITVLHDALRLEENIPPATESLILYNICCAESRLAQSCGDDNQRRPLLENALKSLERWLEQGTQAGWAALGRSSENRMDFLCNDDDVFFLLQQRKAEVEGLAARYGFTPLQIPEHPSGKSGSCVPFGTPIHTPRGMCRVEEIGVGATISSIDIENGTAPITSSVTRIRTSRAARCVHINQAFCSTLSQPLYECAGGWIPAGQIKVGMEILTGTGGFETVQSCEEVEGYFEIYVLSTDHPSHNYIANGFVCHNEKPASAT